MYTPIQNKLKTAAFTTAIILLALSVFPAAAQIEDIQNAKCIGLNIACGANLQGFIFNVIDVFLLLVGVIALGALIYGGFKYITSLGNDEDINKGKRIVIYAVVGLIVVGVSAVIVNFVIDRVI